MQRSNVKKSVCRKKAIKSVQQKVWKTKISCGDGGLKPTLVTQQLQGGLKHLFCGFTMECSRSFLLTPLSSMAFSRQTKAVRSLQYTL